VSEDEERRRLLAEIARLTARAEALESALEERSRELLRIQRHVCRRDLVLIARLRAGLPALPRGAYEPALWRETIDFLPADVEETLSDLWSSIAPAPPTPPAPPVTESR
jgi:hypothetical protein